MRGEGMWGLDHGNKGSWGSSSEEEGGTVAEGLQGDGRRGMTMCRDHVCAAVGQTGRRQGGLAPAGHSRWSGLHGRCQISPLLPGKHGGRCARRWAPRVLRPTFNSHKWPVYLRVPYKHFLVMCKCLGGIIGADVPSSGGSGIQQELVVDEPGALWAGTHSREDQGHVWLSR